MDPTGPRDREFDDALGELQCLVLGVAEVECFLEEVAGLAAAVAPGVVCGITTRYDSHPVTTAASDARAAIADEKQYGAGEGPCLEAMATGLVVDVPDQEADHRWGAYRAAALALGVRCSLSLPLFVHRVSVGALNLYGFEAPGTFNGSAHHRAEVFAGQASTALTLALRFNDQAARCNQLEEALRSRSAIDQALGMIMAQQQCDAQKAFEMLRQRSQSCNRKIRDVAVDLVERSSGQPDSGPSPFEETGGTCAR